MNVIINLITEKEMPRSSYCGTDKQKDESKRFALQVTETIFAFTTTTAIVHLSMYLCMYVLTDENIILLFYYTHSRYRIRIVSPTKSSILHTIKRRLWLSSFSKPSCS